MLGMQNEREWGIFTKIIENPELQSDERFKTTLLRSKNRNELRTIIEDAFSNFSADEVLDNAGIANAKVTDMAGLWNHPQLKARNRWTEVMAVYLP